MSSWLYLHYSSPSQDYCEIKLAAFFILLEYDSIRIFTDALELGIILENIFVWILYKLLELLNDIV